MKRVMTSALVLSLLASGAAMAQDGPGMRSRGERMPNRQEQGQPQGGGAQFQQRQDNGGYRGDGGQRQPPQRPQAQQPQAQPPQAQPPQAQPQQGQPQRGDNRGPDNRGQDNRGQGGRGPGEQGRGDRGPDNRGPDNRGQDNRGQGNRGPDNRYDGRGYDGRNDNQPGMRSRGNPYDNGARPGANRPPPQQGRPGGQQFRDRDRGRQQYDQRNWRPSFRPQQRYRAPAWRPPIGFYAYNWRFGDYLPGGWYGQSYYLNWGSYGLPLPPIGCEWVRVGDDAILVDTWSGRVLSVAYDVFW